MRRSFSRATVVALVLAGAVSTLPAQQPAPDLILSNGKIITVDERFTIAQAVAIRAIASSRSAPIRRSCSWRGQHAADRPAGRAVIPGLIDNHMHLLRAGTTWQWEVRLDGVESRTARARHAARTREVGRAWRMDLHLGGWAIEQFADDKRAVHARGAGPGRPEQSGASAGVRITRPISTAARCRRSSIDDASTQNAAIVRDAAGKPTGRISEAGFRQLVGKAADGAARADSRGQHAGDDQGPEPRRPDGVRQRGLRCRSCSRCIASGPTKDKLNVRVVLHRRRQAAATPRAGGSRAAAHRADEAVSGRQLHRQDLLRRKRLRAAARPDVRRQVRSETRAARRSGAASRPRSPKRGLPLHVHAEPDEHDRRVPRSDRGDQQGISRSRTCAGRWPTSTSSTRRTSSG